MISKSTILSAFQSMSSKAKFWLEASRGNHGGPSYWRGIARTTIRALAQGLYEKDLLADAQLATWEHEPEECEARAIAQAFRELAPQLYRRASELLDQGAAQYRESLLAEADAIRKLALGLDNAPAQDSAVSTDVVKS